MPSAVSQRKNRLNLQVVAHDQSAQDLNPLDSDLKVVKLHGDFLFSDISNTEQQTKDLRRYMREGLELFLRVGGLIVVGYSGRDESIMAPIESRMDDLNAFAYPLYWIIREGSDPPERVSGLLIRAGTRAALIQAPNSDHFFWQLRRHLCGEEAAGPNPDPTRPFPLPARKPVLPSYRQPSINI